MHDKKEYDILDKFSLPYNSKIIKFRNLNEFKRFEIERINPNHVINLYGILKNNSKKKNVCKIIYCGRILIPSLLLFTMEINNLIYLIPFDKLPYMLMCIFISLIYWRALAYVLKLDFKLRWLYDYWNTWWIRFRKNYINDILPL